MKKIYVSDLICVNDSIEETRNFFEKNGRMIFGIYLQFAVAKAVQL